MADEQKQEEQTTEESTAAEATEQTADESQDTQEQGGDEQAAATDTGQEEAAASDDAGDAASGDNAGAEESAEEVPEEFKDLIERIEQMSVLELNKLVKTLENRFGVSAQAVAAAPAGGGGGEAAEEKDEFTVVLNSVGDQKIQVIKVVKEALGLGLKEAKEMAEELPATLKENVKKEEAEELKGKIEEAGGSVELQ
jgi:large subunit ribosomal protein L7/L12